MDILTIVTVLGTGCFWQPYDKKQMIAKCLILLFASACLAGNKGILEFPQNFSTFSTQMTRLIARR